MTPEVFTRRQQVELLGKLGPRNMKDMSMALKVPLTQLLEAPQLVRHLDRDFSVSPISPPPRSLGDQERMRQRDRARQTDRQTDKGARE